MASVIEELVAESGAFSEFQRLPAHTRPMRVPQAFGDRACFNTMSRPHLSLIRSGLCLA